MVDYRQNITTIRRHVSNMIDRIIYRVSLLELKRAL